MKLSQTFTTTQRQAPRDEQSKSAQFLQRAGFIHKEMAGVYSFLPLGLRVLTKIQQIVREEMNAIGGQELQMTTLQSPDIWELTDRWDDTKMDIWFKTKLQNGHPLGLAPTHEEPMTRIIAAHANSYKELPIYTYQFQWKMRNELRAKSGIMRGREFLMKDMYSFSATQDQHDQFYDQVKDSYFRIYNRLGIGDNTYCTYASGGPFSKYSHEFQTVLPVGEDTIHIDDKKKLAINEEIMSDELLSELKLHKDSLRQEPAAEVGNIFPLGTKYSVPLGATFTDEQGKVHPMIMGSYGVGVSRLVGVLAEYFSDEKGLVWPKSVAPAMVHIVRIGDDQAVAKAADQLYQDLAASGIDTIYDDRDTSAGAKFADADLIGCPWRVTISPKTLDKNLVELKARTSEKSELIATTKLIPHLLD